QPGGRAQGFTQVAGDAGDGRRGAVSGVMIEPAVRYRSSDRVYRVSRGIGVIVFIASDGRTIWRRSCIAAAILIVTVNIEISGTRHIRDVGIGTVEDQSGWRRKTGD